MLAAEMIHRSTDAVWTRVGPAIQGLVASWHALGKVDRALGFMMSSGRPEFFADVWPLITHENDQVHFAALRAGKRFRPSVLGSDAAKRLSELPTKIRHNVLHEIAANSGMDGLDLAATVAAADPDPHVKAIAVEAFAFRHAHRHAVQVLRVADAKTFDLVARKGDLIEDLEDETVKNELAAARERLRKQGVSDYDKMHDLVYAHGNDNLIARETRIGGTVQPCSRNRTSTIRRGLSGAHANARVALPATDLYTGWQHAT
jgi:hypothetical protein